MESVKDSIIQSGGKILLAFNRGDAKEVARNYFKEAKLLFLSSDVVQGMEEIEAYWKIVMNRGIKIVKLETTGTEVSGATALEVGKYELFLENGHVADIGEYVAIWRNKNDKWKLYFHQWNSNNQVNENPSIQINKCELSSERSYINFKSIKSDRCLYLMIDLFVKYH